MPTKPNSNSTAAGLSNQQTNECCYMRHPTPDYPLLALYEALQSLTGAGIAILMVCSVAGAIPAAAELNDLPQPGEWLGLMAAWIAHWAVAGIMIWGVLPAIVIAWCFHELLHGTSRPKRVLGITFLTQLIVSTVAMLVMESGPEWQRVAVASASGVALLGISAVICRLIRGRAAPAVKHWIG